jgi:hypothetical protein
MLGRLSIEIPHLLRKHLPIFWPAQAGHKSI